MTAIILRGDARNLPLPDETVDLVVTSPPFLNLRSYQDGGQHYEGQIGTGTQAQFLEDLWAVTAECARVLKPTGSIFVELGDSYTNKSLNMSPHRYAIGCVDKLGLLLRAEIVWSRSNGLPESVTDRVRRSHSVWFHLTKQPRYYAAVDNIRQPHISKPGREGTNCLGGQKNLRAVGPNSGKYNALGALPGSVWEIPTEPLQVPAHLGIDHFAAYPMEWPRRIILGWSPSGICTACGEGRRPAVERGRLDPVKLAQISARRGRRTGTGGEGQSRRAGATSSANAGISGQEWGALRSPDVITGEVCGCPDTTAPTRPAVVLDPFGGTGTTALVAHALGRTGVSVDMSADYCRLARWRTTDPGQIAKALGVPKPPVQLAGQTDLLAELDGGAA